MTNETKHPFAEPTAEEIANNETKHPFADPTPDEIANQEAKDFFPPGTGWNHAKRPEYPGKFRERPSAPANDDN